MAGCPITRGCGCLVVPRPPKLSLQCKQMLFATAQVLGGGQRAVRAQALHWCASDYYKLQQTLCGVWSMLQAPFGRFSSILFSSAKPRGFRIMQRTVEFKVFSYLWIMFGRERCHAESFKPAWRRAVWRGFGLRNTSTSPRGSRVLCPNCSAVLVGAHFTPSGRDCRMGWHKTGHQT